MSLKARIQEEMKTAMKAKDKDTLTALKSIKAKIQLAETASGASEELTEAEEFQLLMKEAKQRKDSAQVYQDAGREELAEVELKELAVIEKFLPQQMSDEEISNAVSEIIAKTGATSIKDMGKVMGMASKELAGKADNKKVADFVKKLLNQ
ncbi:GatB/YqeY domain-containing protein [Limibacter armeniacum]|uniref:GatB/YqeY domain-containing protein n=1 Tax=Limibacter armeniacum TaxID=466084 RepID=UPI002FE5EC74